MYHTPPPLTRPKSLVRAARINLNKYVRDKNLRQLISGRLPPGGEAHGTLRAKELALNTARQDGSLSYRVEDHIRVLTALLAEMRLLQNRSVS